MDSKTQKLAIQIIDNLLKHPISDYFKYEVIPGVDADVDYTQIVKNPQDLETIKRKLNENIYKDIHQWMQDVETVWANAEKYNGTGSSMGIAAREMRKQFERERRVFCSYNRSSWISEVYRLRVKLEKLVQLSPSKIHKNIHEAYLMTLPKYEVLDISEHDLQCLKIALEMLNSDESSREIMRIIYEKQPELKNIYSNLSLDTGFLKLPTLQAIQKYAKHSLENQGKKYPE